MQCAVQCSMWSLPAVVVCNIYRQVTVFVSYCNMSVICDSCCYCRGHDAAVLCVQFDSRKIISGSCDKTIKVLLQCSVLSFLSRTVFTMQAYVRAVFGVVILSVHPSVTCMDCDKTKWYTADILIPHIRAITLLLWYQQWLVGNAPFHLKSALKLTHPLRNTPTLTNFRL